MGRGKSFLFIFGVILVVLLRELVLAQPSYSNPSSSLGTTFDYSQSKTTFPPGHILSREGEYVPGRLIIKFEDTPEINGILTNYDSINKLNLEYSITSIENLFKKVSSTVAKIQKTREKYPIRAKRTPNIDIAKIGAKIGLERIYEIVVPENVDIRTMAKKYSENPNIQYAEPRFFYYLDLAPNDLKYKSQWAHQKTQAELGWDIEQGSEEITIAFLDDGIDYNHEDLKENIWENVDEKNGDINNDGCPGICEKDDDGDGLIDEDSQGCGKNNIDAKGDICNYKNDLREDDDENGYADDTRGWDFFSQDNDPFHENGDKHGTHTTGIAAAIGNNEIGIAGVCWKCKIMPLKIFGISGSSVDVEQVTLYAVDNGADIISNSWGGYGYSQMFADIISYAHSTGIVIVGSAGNEISNDFHYPSDFDNVIKVASTDNDDSRSGFSNYGSRVDVAAPGGDIISTVPNNDYISLSGTSMAAPYISGLVGLLLSHNPSLTNTKIREILRHSVDFFGIDIPKPNKYIGEGRINIPKAFSILDSDSISNTIAIIHSPEKEQNVLGILPIEITARGKFVLKFAEGIYPSQWEILATGESLEKKIPIELDTLNYIDSIYTLRLEVSDAKGTNWDITTIEIDNVKILKPHDNEYINLDDIVEVSALVPKESEYTLEYSQLSNPNEWYSNGIITNIENGIIKGNWDTTGLVTGTYYLRLKAKYRGKESQDIIKINIESFQKGWPRSTDNAIRSSPIIFDIDNDGFLEVIAGSMDGNLYAWNHDGNLAWSLFLYQRGIHATPAIGDLDNDGSYEIIVNDGGGKINIISSDGKIIKTFGDDSNPSSHFFSPPTLYDINKDGKIEILIGSYGKINLFDKEGQLLKEFKTLETDEVIASPVAIGDLDNDGNVEIIAGSRVGVGPCTSGRLSIWDNQGNLKTGWPKDIDYRIDNAPVIGDIDNNGNLEVIIAHGGCYTINDEGEIFVFDYLGDILWKKEIKWLDVESSPVLLDIKSDKLLEIGLFSSDNGLDVIHIFDSNGEYIQGWPKYFSWDTPAKSAYPTPAIGDIDSDNEVEIIVGSYKERLHGLNHDGSIISGWPKATTGRISGTPSLGDLDNDGDIEVVTGSHDGKVYVWDLVGKYDPTKIQWPMFQHDIWHTGSYGFIPLEPEKPQFIRGDPNRDKKIDLTDAIFILGALFRGENTDLFNACLDASDTNDDGKVDLTDPIYLLGYLFQGRNQPPSPFPEQGEDPTEDQLDCER